MAFGLFKVKREGTAVANGDNDGNDFVSVVQYRSNNPTGANSIAGTDFEQFGPPHPVATGAMTEGNATTERKDIGSLTASTQFTWVLDATGQSWIARSGETKPASSTVDITHLAFCEGHDILDDPYAGANDTLNTAIFFMRDTATAGDQPVLSVDHTAPVAGGGARSFTLLGVGN